jgi:hypothetical protein
MAFTVTVTDRHDLDAEPGHGCDTCATDTANSAAPQAVQDQVDSAITVRLSPLED